MHDEMFSQYGIWGSGFPVAVLAHDILVLVDF